LRGAFQLRLLRQAVGRDRRSRRGVVAHKTTPARTGGAGGRVMLIRLSQDLTAYLYDVFVARFDLWLAFGIVAQLLFGARFIVQWIASERSGRSIMPLAFWFFSMAGGLMTLVYGLVRRQPTTLLPETPATVTYVRNRPLIL